MPEIQLSHIKGTYKHCLKLFLKNDHDRKGRVLTRGIHKVISRWMKQDNFAQFGYARTLASQVGPAIATAASPGRTGVCGEATSRGEGYTSRSSSAYLAL